MLVSKTVEAQQEQTALTHERLYHFLSISQAWLAKNENNTKTKLAYAIERVTPRIQKVLREYQYRLEDVDIDACATDDKGFIVKDERGEYKFTKENLKERNRKRQALFEGVATIEPYLATQTPDDLTYVEIQAFAGIVLKE